MSASRNTNHFASGFARRAEWIIGRNFHLSSFQPGLSVIPDGPLATFMWSCEVRAVWPPVRARLYKEKSPLFCLRVSETLRKTSCVRIPAMSSSKSETMILCGTQRRVVLRWTGTLSWASVMPVLTTTNTESIPVSVGQDEGTWLVLVIGSVSLCVSIVIPMAGSITSCVIFEPKSACINWRIKRMRITGPRMRTQRPYRCGREGIFGGSGLWILEVERKRIQERGLMDMEWSISLHIQMEA